MSTKGKIMIAITFVLCAIIYYMMYRYEQTLNHDPYKPPQYKEVRP